MMLRARVSASSRALALYLADHARHVVARILLDSRQQFVAGLILRHARDPLELGLALLFQLLQLALPFVEPALAFVQALVTLFQLVNARIQLRAPLLQAVTFAVQFAAPAAGRLFGILQQDACLFGGRGEVAGSFLQRLVARGQVLRLGTAAPVVHLCILMAA